MKNDKMTKKTLIKNGQVLLAEPFMLDPYFRRAVVLLCEHHEEGSIGFILNKSIDMTVNELVSEFPVFEAEHGEVKSVSKIRRQLPVEEYLRPQQRFAHLFKPPGRPDIVARLQQLADRNIRRYGLLDGTEGTR